MNANLVIRNRCASVLMFQLVRAHAFEQFVRSRGSVGERPLHTRKVAGSIPAGTTIRNRLVTGGFLRSRLARFSGAWALRGPYGFVGLCGHCWLCGGLAR